MAFTTNVDIYILLQRTLHDSTWEAWPNVPPSTFGVNGEKVIVVMTSGAHHYLIAIDYRLRMYSRFGDTNTFGIVNALSEFQDVSMRNVPPQRGSTDCGPMCIYYAEFICDVGESIFHMRRWPTRTRESVDRLETMGEAITRIRNTLNEL